MTIMQCRQCQEPLPLSAHACHTCLSPVPRGPQPAETIELRIGGMARVITDASTLRDRPFSSAREVTRLKLGQIVLVVGIQWDFVQVEAIDTVRGFIEREALVGLVTPEKSPAAKKTSAPGVSGTASTSAPSGQAAASDVTSDPGSTPRPNQRLTVAPTPAPDPPEPAFAEPAGDSTDTAGNHSARKPTTIRLIRPSRGGERAAADSSGASEVDQTLPFNLPPLSGERVRFRGVFLYNPLQDQAFVVTNKRLISVGGTQGNLPRIVHLDEIESVYLREGGSGTTGGEGNLYIAVLGNQQPMRIGTIHTPHIVRNEILAACVALHKETIATDAPR